MSDEAPDTIRPAAGDAAITFASPPPEGRARRVLFSVQKNEGPFLVEWIAFHKVIGFDEIVIYSNDCSDGSDALLDRLADLGEIHHRSHSPAPGTPPQQDAARLFRDSGALSEGDLVLWLDVDEYLCVNVGDGTMDALLGAVGPFDAFLIAWRHFGDGGNETWPGRQISRDFVMARTRDPEHQPYVKTITRWSDMVEQLDIHRPKLVDGLTPKDFHAITSADRRMRRRFVRSHADKFNRLTDPGEHHKLAQVNHYTVRTWDKFREKKERGRGNRSNEGRNGRHTHSYFKAHNFNEVVDDRILIHLDALGAEIARLEGRLSGQSPAT
ncbi:glycosyltransferase family 2 protein [Jannaschia aquimarina]|uniref:Glycosyl transferase family 2 n=1 Tax=Jannaschia aquimarina TaxID=935700 RepID=A0A0D1DCA1_9RHOB|nr:glycosyltransferase family 2 protein [Jannaschia aquimarina]KIT17623.1 hypothetical protein jaqu_05140 [Jannaschia aquimarina]SNS80585.1 Glycosyl transferase family 2 [Jannaschia aquimarina]